MTFPADECGEPCPMCHFDGETLSNTIERLRAEVNLWHRLADAWAQGVLAFNAALGIPPDTLAEKGEDALSCVRRIVALLRESRREHYHCDDSWLCCRACRSIDHCLRAGEDLGMGAGGPGGDRCDCGADAWNAKVDAALKGIA